MDKTEIKNLAHMARIQISEEEIPKYMDLNEILKTIDRINKIDTTDIKPMAHPFNITQRLREDNITESNQRDLLQTVAPDNIEAGIYLVPEVFE